MVAHSATRFAWAFIAFLGAWDPLFFSQYLYQSADRRFLFFALDSSGGFVSYGGLAMSTVMPY